VCAKEKKDWDRQPTNKPTEVVESSKDAKQQHPLKKFIDEDDSHGLSTYLQEGDATAQKALKQKFCIVCGRPAGDLLGDVSTVGVVLGSGAAVGVTGGAASGGAVALGFAAVPASLASAAGGGGVFAGLATVAVANPIGAAVVCVGGSFLVAGLAVSKLSSMVDSSRRNTCDADCKSFSPKEYAKLNKKNHCFVVLERAEEVRCMPQPGDHIKTARTGYEHHGIYVGENEVIHYSGDKTKSGATIRRDTLGVFSQGRPVEVVMYGLRFGGTEAVSRAVSRLEENGYSLVGNNCEHFARWCVTGDRESEQVTDRAAMVGAVVGGGAATGAIAGLATVAGAVGAGAVGGLAAVAAAPATIATAAMLKGLKDDEVLPSLERDARKAGRVATVTGAVAGTGGTIIAVSAMGSVAGLSSAGVMSGLAAIGGTVGGGMAAGTVIAVAAPAVAAVAVGYGLYKVCKVLLGDAPLIITATANANATATGASTKHATAEIQVGPGPALASGLTSHVQVACYS
jgi:hypothetical protein